MEEETEPLYGLLIRLDADQTQGLFCGDVVRGARSNLVFAFAVILRLPLVQLVTTGSMTFVPM